MAGGVIEWHNDDRLIQESPIPKWSARVVHEIRIVGSSPMLARTVFVPLLLLASVVQ